jgi:thiamine-phosphate pyrophosphorylase
VRLHALVEDYETARVAVEGGATVIQLRLKDRPTSEVVAAGRPLRALPAMFVVNDDVEAAIELGADGLHLGRDDAGAERALASGLGREAEQRGAAYIGAGPVWDTPSKLDADPPIGLDGLRAICAAVSVPVVAIGGVDATNAGDCIRAGAAGVAVIRAATDAAALRAAIDEALAAR